MQIFSKALTGGSEWYDKVNAVMIMYDRRDKPRISPRHDYTVGIQYTRRAEGMWRMHSHVSK